MEYTELGQSKIKISQFALGCWPFAGGELWGKQDDSDSIDAVNESIENGINFFDTAPGYGDGRSEEVLGNALVNKRQSNVIGTKVPPSDLSPKNIRRACEDSLKRLKTDYIDLYQIHWPNHDLSILDYVNELKKLKDEGKILTIGVSNFGKNDFSEISELVEVVTNQLPYNALWRAIEFEIKPVCISKQSGIICYSPLAQGLLTGRYRKVEDVPDGVSRSRLFSKSTSKLCRHNDEGCEDLLFKCIDKIVDLSNSYDIDPAVMSLCWLKKQKGVISMLVGARNKNEVLLNKTSFEGEISDEISELFNKITNPIKAHIGDNPDMWNAISEYR